MKTAMQLLETAPTEQVRRLQIVVKAISAGEWMNAAFTLRNAAQECAGEFAVNCIDLAVYCDRQVVTTSV